MYKLFLVSYSNLHKLFQKTILTIFRDGIAQHIIHLYIYSRNMNKNTKKHWSFTIIFFFNNIQCNIMKCYNAIELVLNGHSIYIITNFITLSLK
jgi:hypothetical protein